MRLEEMFNYPCDDKLDEASYSAGSNIKDTMMSLFGSKQAKGNKEAGQKANDWMKEFRQYVGRVVGRGQKFVPSEHLTDFLNSKGVNAATLNIPMNDITPKEAEDFMFKAARQSFMRKVHQDLSRDKTPETAPTVASDTEASRVDKLVSLVKNLSDDDLQEFLKKL